MTPIGCDERGSALMLTVMAMLVLGVLSVSFALLADIETKIGVSYKQQALAETLAEAAFERARDAVQTATTSPGGFTPWFSGPTATHMLFSNRPLAGGTYTARIDNDCAAVNTVPAAIQEPGHPGPCDNNTDYNQVAVITAWAQAGTGRARVRAIVGVDNPWKHVCSDAKPDNNGYCNDPLNMKGNPTVSPGDPNDPNGPAAYTSLPLPVLGCSRIDPTVHNNALLWCTTNGNPLARGLFTQPANATYPAYPPVPPAGPRVVLMGEDPVVTATARTCNQDPLNPGIQYFGYFDCALSTPCDAAHNCTTATATPKGCVKPTDSRAVGNPSYAAPTIVGGVVTVGCQTKGATGMVYQGNTTIHDMGTSGTPVTLYVMGPNYPPVAAVTASTVPSGTTVYGTIVVEGNINTLNKFTAYTGGPPNTVGVPPAQAYGYPLAGLTYDPQQPYPTISPIYAPQNITATYGSANTLVHGMVYSGGNLAFHPITVDGGVMAFNIVLQASSSSYTYNYQMGDATPPPGFQTAQGGNPVVVIRKSFLVCSKYNDDTAGPTVCN